MMSGDRKFLIDFLSGARLDDRFVDITPINCDPSSGEKIGRGGALSLVFRAFDESSKRPVAIKFFDPAFGGIQYAYRLEAFKRESDLLSCLIGKDRCLQLVMPLRELPVPVPVDGTSITVTYSYFVLEWLEGDIQDFFYKQETFDAIAKLRVFRNVLLSVFALHNNNICHRDLKADNLMRAHRALGELVVAIDFGTATALDGPSIGRARDYAQPVGATGFAPIEAFCGLAAVRSIGVKADIYATGCLLHDLFNVDLFYVRLLGDRGYAECRSACERHMLQNAAFDEDDDEELLTEWRKIIRLTKGQVTLPGIGDSADSTAPPAVASILDELLRSMTAVDLDDRSTNLDQFLRRLDTAIRMLEHDVANRRAREERRRRRAIRAERAQAKAKRLQEYLGRKA